LDSATATAEPTRTNSGLHIPSLDGIRAIAAMIVFVSHAGWSEVIPGGFGVTVFFFLSGYLITTLLRQEYEQTGGISLSRFYLRRVFRIIPPLYIVLLLLLFLGRDGVHPTPAAVAAQFAQLTNYYAIVWGTARLIPDSGPTWSLAVEEHFYLLFPLLLIALLRANSYRKIALVLTLLCAAVLMWRCWLIFGFKVRYDYTYYATDSRFDSLLYGCVMAIGFNPVLDRQLIRLNNKGWIAALLVSAGLLALSFLYRSEPFRATLRYSVQGVALIPIFFTAIRHHTWPIYRWLEARPVRFLGLISYTFYLVHLRCLGLVSRYFHGSQLVRALLGFALAVAASTAMYYLVERHLAQLRRRLHTLLPARSRAATSKDGQFAPNRGPTTSPGS
jgi:peptidoglycan/LPS O-acetylase OafA/YrhL